MAGREPAELEENMGSCYAGTFLLGLPGYRGVWSSKRSRLGSSCPLSLLDSLAEKMPYLLVSTQVRLVSRRERSLESTVSMLRSRKPDPPSVVTSQVTQN